MDQIELLQAMQKMMEANQVKAEANMGRQISSLVFKMDANQGEMKAAQEMMEANQARMEESLKEAMRVTVSAFEEKMQAIVHPSWSERDEKVPHRSENVTEQQEIPKEGAAVANVDCKDQGPRQLESGVESQLVPAEEVAVKSSRTKKRPRSRCIAAGRHVKPTKLIRGDSESWRKLVATCRKVSRCAAVAWRRRHIFGNLRTQGNYGPRQKLGAAGIMVTLHAKLARQKGTSVRKNRFRAKIE
jgi:hypothetical protein